MDNDCFDRYFYYYYIFTHSLNVYRRTIYMEITLERRIFM